MLLLLSVFVDVNVCSLMADLLHNLKRFYIHDVPLNLVFFGPPCMSV